LDHLLAADYDPASKPGTATALLNEIVESDSGVSRFTANALANAPSGTGASAATISAAVWNSLKADYTTADTFGDYLDTEVSGIAGGSGLTAQETRNAMQLAPTGGTTHAGSVDAHLDDIVADTSELQTDDVPALIAALDAVVDTKASQASVDTIDGEVGDILADTAALQADWANGGRLDLIIDQILADTGTDGVAISATVANQIADAILNRDMSSVSDTNSRTMLNALRILRNKWSVAGTTMTVTKENDTTAAWTSTVSVDASADPITGSDPA